ncbi:unnamed protein product, partial [Durusdinium trenchii]
MMAFKAVLASLLFSALARPEGLSINHSLFEERQAVPGKQSGALVRRAASTDVLHTLHAVENLKADALSVILEFVRVAKGGYTASNFDGMLTAIESTMGDLSTGNPSKNLIAPPNADTTTKVQQLSDTTNTLHALLRGNIASVASTSTAVLTDLNAQYRTISQDYDMLILQYQAYAQMTGVAEKMVEAYAHQLESYSVSLCVDATLILLNINEQVNLDEMKRLQRRFSSLLESIAWGDVVAGIADLTNVCQLQAILTVAKDWFDVQTRLQPVLTMDRSNAESVLEDLSGCSATLRGSLTIFIHQAEQPDCNPLSGMDATLWKNGINEINQVRRLIAQAARIYLQAREVSDSSLELLVLSQAISDGASAISNSYKGSYVESVPVAPTQELVDLMKTVYDEWLTFKSDVERGMLSLSGSMVDKIISQSSLLDTHLQQVGVLYVAAATAAGLNRAILWQLIQQNRAMLENLAKEALIISAADTAEGKTGTFDSMALSFENVHWELLRGASGSLLIPQVPVARTTDACILTKMAKVKTDYEALKNILIQMYGSKDFLNNHLGFIAAEAASPVLVDAFLAFKRGWDEFRPSDELRMQDLQIAYIYGNPNAVGSKDNLDFAQGDEYYHQAHKQFHPTYRAILYERNYYDIFIFDLQGNLIYSVYKELDYATNFLANGAGEWKDSGLGEAFRAAVVNPDIINIIDWKPYGPSYGALASFLSTGIKQDGQLIGVFCTQMPPESKPVQVTEMQPLLDKAVDCITTVVSSYLAGYGTCTTVLDATSWEIMLEESSLLRWRFFVTSTEFALLTHGFSQNWLNASAMGLEEHKGFLVIEASKSTLADALWAFKLAWDAFRETDAERLLSLQIAYILLNPFPTGEKDKLDRAEGIEEYHAVHAQYHPT